MAKKPTSVEDISNEKDVIEKAYELTTNPEILDEFERYWEAYIDSRLEKKDAASVNLKDEPINAHIMRAIEIVERMGVLKSLNAHAQTIVDSNYGIGFIIDDQERIIAQNLDASHFLEGASKLSDLKLDPQSSGEISAWIEKNTQLDGEDILFKDVSIVGKNQTMCLFITRLKLIEELDHSNQFHFLVTSVDFDIDPETVQAIRNKFGLTQAECEIAISLANGMNNNEIAFERKVLKSTIDKQVKSIREKTETRSIVDLVRRIGRMSSKMSAVSSQISREQIQRQ